MLVPPKKILHNPFIFHFLGSARVSFTPTPLNLKRFFPTLLFLNKLMILKKNPKHQEKHFFLLIFKYHLKIGGMVWSVGFPSHSVMGGQKKFKNSGQGQHYPKCVWSEVSSVELRPGAGLACSSAACLSNCSVPWFPRIFTGLLWWLHELKHGKHLEWGLVGT